MQRKRRHVFSQEREGRAPFDTELARPLRARPTCADARAEVLLHTYRTRNSGSQVPGGAWGRQGERRGFQRRRVEREGACVCGSEKRVTKVLESLFDS